MTIRIVQTLEDGGCVVEDDADNYRAVLAVGQYAAFVDAGGGRERLERLVALNRTSGEHRSDAEQAAMQGSEQGQGDRHQEQERGE